MDKNALIKKFRKMPWEHWLKRRYPVLVPYLMARSATKQAFARCGVKGEWPIILFERGVWYGTPEMFGLAGKDAEKYLKKLGAAFLTKICSLGYKKARQEIGRMLKNTKASPLTQYKRVVDLLEPINVSVWTAHASEVYLDNVLRKRLVKYMPAEKLDEYIGDIGFPKHKNAYALLADDVLKGVAAEKLYDKYSWLKSRAEAGFSSGYTLAEMEELRHDILGHPPDSHVHPLAPPELRGLVGELQEIVYLRTLRTDCLFEIYFRSAPVFARLEKELGIGSVGYYLPENLAEGKLDRYDDRDCTVLKYYDDIVVTRERIASERIVGEQEIKGVIAWKGKVSGRVRVIFSPTKAHTVKSGEILVTNMTTPAYLLAMKKAAAFVTDEGGITCHAAIIAREMKKPCIIGTKIATQVLKDGDMVEVDANKGVVKKIYPVK